MSGWEDPSVPRTDPDLIFADPRLAEIYDDLDGERDDLDFYETIIAELGASGVLDIGCGPGSLRVALRSEDSASPDSIPRPRRSTSHVRSPTRRR